MATCEKLTIEQRSFEVTDSFRFSFQNLFFESFQFCFCALTENSPINPNNTPRTEKVTRILSNANRTSRGIQTVRSDGPKFATIAGPNNIARTTQAIDTIGISKL